MDSVGDILVVGASRGIGRALVEELLARGGRVFGVSSSTEADGDRPGLGDRYHYLQCDIAGEGAGADVLSWLRGHDFNFDMIVLNAGITHQLYAQNITLAAIQELFSVNFFGLLRVFLELFPELQRRNSGTVVVVSSLAAYRGLSGAGAYCASKAALTSLFESFRLDLQGTNIRVVQVFPYLVISAMSNPEAKPNPLAWKTPRQAARQICDGIARGQEVICFPPIMHFVFKTFQVIPRGIYFKFWDFLKL